VWAAYNPLLHREQAAQIAQQIVTKWLPGEKESLFLLCQNTWT
jgi:hypothetical protein